MLKTVTHRILSYLRYRIKSKGKFKVHSPFVYKLYTEGIHQKISKEIFSDIENYRKELKRNHTIIEVIDLGASKTKNKKKSISSIAKSSPSTPRKAQQIYSIAKFLDAKNILELGTNLGIGTAYLAKACSEAEIKTVEACPNILSFAKAFLKKIKAENTQVFCNDFDNYLSNNSLSHDLIFIDGNHTKEATLQYFEIFLEKNNKEFAIIFDDVYWSKGMTEAWETIKKNKKVNLSIDFYSFGLVFVGKDISKQDFVLK
jgi:predicted O-methyltransferase YrrM